MLFTEQIADLVRADVRFVVIGGVAASLHGSARVTFDLDLCYDPAPDNRERLASVLRGWGAYLRGVEPGLPFTMDARALQASHVLTLTTRLGDLDVMDAVAGVGDYTAVVAASATFAVGGVRCQVLDLPALIQAKRAAGRTKDRDQLPGLEALLEIKTKRRK